MGSIAADDLNNSLTSMEWLFSFDSSGNSFLSSTPPTASAHKEIPSSSFAGIDKELYRKPSISYTIMIYEIISSFPSGTYRLELRIDGLTLALDHSISSFPSSMKLTSTAFDYNCGTFLSTTHSTPILRWSYKFAFYLRLSNVDHQYSSLSPHQKLLSFMLKRPIPI